MSELKQVDLDQQFINVCGIRLSGFADGDVVTIEFDGPAWLLIKGSGGDFTRSKNLDRSAVMKIRLMSTSDVNDQLSALHNADMASTNGRGVGPSQFEDGQGRTLLHAEQSYIEAPPNITIAASPGPREWTVRLTKLEGNWGGN
jgi:hypothetical protein